MRRALLRFLRATHLIGLADKAAGLRAVAQERERNDLYRRAHPSHNFPDPALVFEVAGHASIQQFDETGAAHAAFIASQLKQAGLPPAPRVLEWGCGPARILGHMHAALNDPAAALYGCDPDASSIAFAARAHPDIAFTRVAFEPPTLYQSAGFDAIYGVSIFTHLDEASAKAWVEELARISAGSACVLVTTHGEAAAAKLQGGDRAAFDAGRYLTLGGAREGSRTYAAYVSEAAGRALFAPHFTEISFRAASPDELNQDIWLLKQPRRA